MTVQDGTAEVTSTEAAPEHTVPFPTRAAEQATQTAHQHRYSDLTSTPELEDGPLFRAILSANVQRVKSLRSSLKSFLRAAEDAVDNMQDAAASQLAVDASLDALSAGSQSSDVLRGLWSGTLKAKRDQRRTHELKEIQQLQCVIVNIREAVDRLKSVDQRRKAFEADSKKHYDELGKVRTFDVYSTALAHLPPAPSISPASSLTLLNRSHSTQSKQLAISHSRNTARPITLTSKVSWKRKKLPSPSGCEVGQGRKSNKCPCRRPKKRNVSVGNDAVRRSLGLWASGCATRS